MVGGDVLQARIDYPLQTQNTCALKVSIALVGVGINIPNIAGETLEGEDGNFYFLNAVALTEWLKETFGEPNDDITHIYAPFSELDNLNSIFPPNKAIFVGIYERSANGPSGNADIYTGSRCSAAIDCYWIGSIEMHLWI